MSESQCCENPPTLSSTCGAGSVIELGGLMVYVAAGPSSDSHSAIILIHDIHGCEAPNSRKFADKVAATTQYYVVVPDFFHGDPFQADNPEKPIAVWRQMHGTDRGFEDAKPLIHALNSKGVASVGDAGFCWGAKVAVELATCELIQAAVLLHPSRVTVEDIKEVKTPIAVLGAEFDQMSPPELIEEFGEVLSKKPEVDGYVKIFPGVAHGWAVRYNIDDEMAVKSAEEAHQNMVDWFVQYLK